MLTLTVTGVEVSLILAMMFSGSAESTVARDAMFAVLMIVLNGMVGLCLVIGGWKFREQSYNLRGATTFLAVIVPMAVIGLGLPNFTHATNGPTFSRFQAVFISVTSIGLYAVFLAIQNVRHREYFVDPENASALSDRHAVGHSSGYHAALLVAYLVPVVLMAKKLAAPIDFGISVLNVPAALGGFFVAVLVLSPESLGALRAARVNQLQRAINILLGSALATISLSFPAISLFAAATGRPVILGLDPADITLLVQTLAVSYLTFTSRRTNVLLGAVHLLLFLAYLMLMFER